MKVISPVNVLVGMLEKIEVEQLLRTTNDFLKQGENAEVEQIWKTLSEDQKKGGISIL